MTDASPKPSSPFTAAEEDRIREIAREEAAEVAVAASRCQAQIAANQVIDRTRFSKAELAGFLGTASGDRA